MKRVVHRTLLIAAMLLPLSTQAEVPSSFAPVVEPLMPAVVNISTTQKVVTPQGMQFNFPNVPGNDPQSEQLRELFRQFSEQFGGGDMEREVSSLGSGFVIDPTGYVVTNNHVIANATQVSVIFSDNTHLNATIVGRDSKTDLALLKVKTDKKLPYVSLGDSDALKVGDWVIAVGNPFGLGGSVSAGIVSARGRNINAGPFDDFIQTDAAINRGNSGGPLFNAKGEVVGINSAIFSPTGGNIGIGFAVPTSLAKPVIDQLRRTGKVERAWLGVKIQQVSEEIANSIGLKEPKGALLLEISPKSPAEGSGLQPGDVILKFDGRDIPQMRNLPRIVAETKAGKDVEVVVYRKGKEITYHLSLAEQPKEAQEENAVPDLSQNGKKLEGKKPIGKVLGMSLIAIDDAVRAQFRIPKDVKGLLIVELERDSEPAKQGLRPGDVIIDVNQTPVMSSKDVITQIETARKAGRDYVLMRMRRGEAIQFITVPTK